MKSSGFTLIELVMVLVIMSAISLVASKVLFQAAQTFTTQKNVSETDWQSLVALERMTADIHRIRSASDISTITSNTLSFVDVSGNSVQYTLSGTTLLRGSQTLATGINSLIFSYLDNTGAVTVIASDVRYISITLGLTQGNLVSSVSTLVGTRGLT